MTKFLLRFNSLAIFAFLIFWFGASLVIAEEYPELKQIFAVTSEVILLVWQGFVGVCLNRKLDDEEQLNGDYFIAALFFVLFLLVASSIVDSSKGVSIEANIAFVLFGALVGAYFYCSYFVTTVFVLNRRKMGDGDINIAVTFLLFFLLLGYLVFQNSIRKLLAKS